MVLCAIVRSTDDLLEIVLKRDDRCEVVRGPDDLRGALRTHTPVAYEPILFLP